MPPNGAASCAQGDAKRIASRVPFQGSGGSGARQRSAPTGGLANGMPSQAWPPWRPVVPTRRPDWTARRVTGSGVTRACSPSRFSAQARTRIVGGSKARTRRRMAPSGWSSGAVLPVPREKWRAALDFWYPRGCHDQSDAMSPPSSTYRAVIFDVGGVIVGSPLDAIAEYEREHGIPAGLINRVVVTTGAAGAWPRLERGELSLEDFYPAFDADCARGGCPISARDLMIRVAAATVVRPAMLDAIARIRAQGLLVAVITNNWITEDGGTDALRDHFDVFIESAVVGVRKPDPVIFHLACDRAGIAPAEAIFLDDIGANLKTARALGMTTIKVADPAAALAELEGLLGFPLRPPA